MVFKLYVLTVLIPLNGNPTSNVVTVPYETPCFPLETILSGETLIDKKTGLRMITKARCVPDAPILNQRLAPIPAPRQYSPYDPDDPLRGYNPLEGIVPQR